MMKKTILAIIIMAAFVTACAAGGADVFVRAKECTALFVLGQYDLAADALAGTLNTEDLKGCAAQIRQMPAQAQALYAISWKEADGGYLAVPLTEPGDGYIDTLVFTICEGSFTEVSVQKWRDVQTRYENGYDVYWNMEYVPGFIVLAD